MKRSIKVGYRRGDWGMRLEKNIVKVGVQKNKESVIVLRSVVCLRCMLKRFEA